MNVGFYYFYYVSRDNVIKRSKSGMEIQVIQKTPAIGRSFRVILLLLLLLLSPSSIRNNRIKESLDSKEDFQINRRIKMTRAFLEKTCKIFISRFIALKIGIILTNSQQYSNYARFPLGSIWPIDRLTNKFL